MIRIPLKAHFKISTLDYLWTSPQVWETKLNEETKSIQKVELKTVQLLIIAKRKVKVIINSNDRLIFAFIFLNFV